MFTSPGASRFVLSTLHTSHLNDNEENRFATLRGPSVHVCMYIRMYVCIHVCTHMYPMIHTSRLKQLAHINLKVCIACRWRPRFRHALLPGRVHDQVARIESHT